MQSMEETNCISVTGNTTEKAEFKLERITSGKLSYFPSVFIHQLLRSEDILTYGRADGNLACKSHSVPGRFLWNWHRFGISYKFCRILMFLQVIITATF